MKNEHVCDIYEALLEKIGHLQWWPADTPFEVVIGTILTQQTKWTNVEKAIKGLKKYDLIEPGKLARADLGLIEGLVRGCGFYRQKAKRLKDIAGFFAREGTDNILSMPTPQLRNLMLSLNGVGNETADSIVLYAADKPKFVIDAYTTRIMKCIGIEGNYMQLQEMFEKNLPEDVPLYKEYHALIVEYAKKYCGKKQCDDCVLTKRSKGED
ncbi:endonuclease III domain-containing protein [Methanococcoides alaskense]|uniref:Endonuclease-3 related protein n=1 Tax=Methanococcoides alaskense TaxID=325778 RepID=A0AA90TYH6_9EURY|nr:endonuclease [Methanococcoides alaskense]MDA0524593.1 endonuclease [Methanococcoides alaskense]MDR6222281.1 endonuclease-3 related protein [Methanococcoides alaskense]